MAYLFLILAVIAEVIGTSLLKASEQFTRVGPTAGLIFFYTLAFYLLTHSLKTLPIGVVYAIWSGLGIVLVTLFGALVYGERPDLPAFIGIGMIIAGIIVLHTLSKMTAH